MREPVDLAAALAKSPAADLDSDPLEKIRAAGADLGGFDSGNITLGHFSGTSPWEQHVDGDELFYVVEGEIHLVLLHEHDAGRDEVRVPMGSVFVIPRGRWHRSIARAPVRVLTLRATDHGPVSFAEDPRD
jgi:mannose-6-phosphate isomerase-like protein (cupin superfamily)